jgi:hypothetical protein
LIRNLSYSALLLLFVSCSHDFSHEKYLSNNSTDTLTIINPDFDTIIYAFPGERVLIYDFKVLDTQQEMEDCLWLGDILLITNEDDSSCAKSVFIEENWAVTISGMENQRLQQCDFSVDDDDFF